MRLTSLMVSVILSLVFLTAHGLENPQVKVQDGWVEGLQLKNTEAFLGIPYAAPPVGNLRWKAPRAVKSWSGVLKAQELAIACPQKGNFFSRVPASEFDKPVGKEDCLYLNVWKPRKVQEKLPVVVWIHGGSNLKGTASDPIYDGAYLSEKSKIVFVSMNYRLGMLGAMASPLINSGDKLDQSGNYVTLDLIQVLSWVKDNIQAFGGDSNNVTIMGQSAGCMNVWGLLQTPLSKNLFHKAICSSGLPNSYPRKIAECRADDFLKNLIVNAGLANNNDDAQDFIKSKSEKYLREFLYSRSTEEIIKAQDFTIPIQHIHDGTVFPHGLEGAALGDFQQVPLIMGLTRDEGTYMVGSSFLKPTQQELWQWIQKTPKGLEIDDLLSVHPLKFKAMTKSSSLALENTLFKLYLGAKVYTPTYRYTFAWDETPYPWNEVFGAVHGLDVAFFLGNFDTHNENFLRFAWSDENKKSREELRDKMISHFTSFFWTDDPQWKGSIKFE
ncbi:carboxylesterase/lipase family protein [Bdellovibrio reynosensis]|uniref:Carboxylic ester hydrolase n=1 Tax=Bdellovibrio reynosensis TaxID=2835041 RepID=A0ABY4CCM8_9BACT|nr:carboxylesterase family protein [Bdellovibrio reynosensis]UOF02539.1 carboxylesterase family protein [Bdellovibrio reynosensis]